MTTLFYTTKDTSTFRENFRRIRNAWLLISDAYMLPDRGLTTDQYDALLIYRQALRDCTGGPNAIAWEIPTKPDFISETVE